MEDHIINIVRFAVCLLSLIISIVLMIKADDNNAMRRLVAILTAIIVFFNEQIGEGVYLILISTIETLLALSGVGFILLAAVVVMLLPIIIFIRGLLH